MTRALGRGLHRRPRRRLHARRGGGGGRAPLRSASPSASSTSTPTPTSTRRRPRPPGTCTAWRWPWPWGAGPAEVVAARRAPPAVVAEHVALVGFRALDPGERAALGELGLALPARRPRAGWACATAAALALDAVENDDGPVVVHLDVDVIDPPEMPAKQHADAGRRPHLRRGVRPADRARWPRRAWWRSRSASTTPTAIPDCASARRLVELVARAVARHLERRAAYVPAAGGLSRSVSAFARSRLPRLTTAQ